jgi:glycosyltransferase involved in cell wall biosynthesis
MSSTKKVGSSLSSLAQRTDKKIRVLLVPSDPYGVGHYRSIWPAQMIQKLYPDEFDVDIRLQTPVTEADLGKFDIIHFHRKINTQEVTLEWIERFKKAGAIVISDIDDYWIPFHGHPARLLVTNTGLHIDIMATQRAADYVTTTTEIYANYLRKLNPNVHIMPNAVNTNLPMWQRHRAPGDVVRVGWLGGSSHERDLRRLHGCFNKLFNDPELKGKFQVVMCGYDTRGTITEVHPDTGKQKTRKLKPEESVWNKFEAIFNDSGRAPEGAYMRRNTLPITQYGKHYNYLDVCLAPLDQHTFNECKSELKIIETGMHGIPIIASDLYRYAEIIEDGVNGFLVPPRKDHKLWAKYIKKLILDDELRENMGTALYNTIYPEYTMENQVRARCAWYREIISNALSKRLCAQYTAN